MDNSKLKRNTEILKDRLHVASVLCNRASIYYTRFKNILLFPNLLISSVSMIFNNQNFDPEVLKYYNTCVNAITVFLIAIQNQMKIAENADLFKTSSNSLLTLLHEVENMENKEEQMTSEFLSNSTQKYDMIMSNLPIIPSSIRERTRNEYGGKFHLPLIINGLAKVSISEAEV
jgi:hypothetical protein